MAMYMVISKWRATPGNESIFVEHGRIATDRIRQMPGVESCQVFLTEDGAITTIGYASQMEYEKLVHSEGGAFEQLSKELRLEEIGEWLWSERGEVLS